jgi:UDP-glucose 4-epimerase
MDLAMQVNKQTKNRMGMRFIPYADAYGTGFEDVHRRIPDMSKCWGLISWQPKVKLETTIQHVIDYQRAELLKQEAT